MFQIASTLERIEALLKEGGGRRKSVSTVAETITQTAQSDEFGNVTLPAIVVDIP